MIGRLRLTARRAICCRRKSPPVPHAPGPFAFADGERLKSILEQSGFLRVRLERLDTVMHMGATVEEAGEEALNLGPLARAASGSRRCNARRNPRPARRRCSRSSKPPPASRRRRRAGWWARRLRRDHCAAVNSPVVVREFVATACKRVTQLTIFRFFRKHQNREEIPARACLMSGPHSRARLVLYAPHSQINLLTTAPCSSPVQPIQTTIPSKLIGSEPISLAPQMATRHGGYRR